MYAQGTALHRDSHNILEGLRALNDSLFNHADTLHNDCRTFASAFDRCQADDHLKATAELQHATFMNINPCAAELQTSHAEMQAIGSGLDVILQQAKKMEAQRAATMHVKAQARKSVADLVSADTTAQIAAIDVEFEAKMAALRAQYEDVASSTEAGSPAKQTTATAAAAATAEDAFPAGRGKEVADV